MKKKIEIDALFCDCCGTKIHLPEVLKNDCSFQYHHINTGNKDLCLTCAALILKDLEIPEDKLNDNIKNIQNRYKMRSNPVISDLSKVFDFIGNK